MKNEDKRIDMILDLLDIIIWNMNFDSTHNVQCMLDKLKEIRNES